MRRRQVAAPTPAETRKKLQKLGTLAERFDQWRPASDVLVPVRAVRTIFPWVDMQTKVGGWPIERVCTLHGPSNEGKSAYVNGLGLSFLMLNHFYALLDAEQTTPIPWLRKLMGGYANHPRFLAKRPRTYEDAVGAVRQFNDTIAEMKAKGEVEPDTSGLVVVDSIRKLSPKKLLDELMKAQKADADDTKRKGRWAKKSKGIDGAGGRAAQIKAALNAQWLDELVPLTAQAGTAIVLIAREISDEDDMFGDDVKVTGGKALIFDSGLVARIYRAEVINEGPEESYSGEKHAIEIRKTKIAKKDERRPRAFFHTTNGAIEGIPEGFDRGRDLLTCALECGVVKLAGSSYSFGRKQLGQGKTKAVRRLTEDATLFCEVDEATRATFELDGVEAPAALPKSPELEPDPTYDPDSAEGSRKRRKLGGAMAAFRTKA